MEGYKKPTNKIEEFTVSSFQEIEISNKKYVILYDDQSNLYMVKEPERYDTDKLEEIPGRCISGDWMPLCETEDLEEMSQKDIQKELEKMANECVQMQEQRIVQNRNK
jgi:hypothetical protein